MTPADLGIEAVSPVEAPPPASPDRGDRRRPGLILLAVLFLIALCSAVALSEYASDRLVALQSQEQLDAAAQRLNAEVSTAAGSNGD